LEKFFIVIGSGIVYGWWAGFFLPLNGDLKMKSCEKCKFRAKYDKNPRSLLGRIWKWHIGWCPGWKSYLKSLSAEEKEKMATLYGK
jgi:hypothetical protein